MFPECFLHSLQVSDFESQLMNMDVQGVSWLGNMEINIGGAIGSCQWWCFGSVIAMLSGVFKRKKHKKTQLN